MVSRALSTFVEDGEVETTPYLETLPDGGGTAPRRREVYMTVVELVLLYLRGPISHEGNR